MSNRTHTDSSVIQYHEDDSWTETTVITHYPATKAEKVQAWGLVGVLIAAPVIPLLFLAGLAKTEEKLEERKAKKAAKKIN